jgi:catechol 2,3-dioxygenase-like lactoylglutathione lyase family enzyme
MAIRRIDHVGIVVDDMAAAIVFFVELGMVERGDGSVGGESVDRIVGLDGVDCDFAMLKTPDGNGGIELIEFRSPPSPAVDPRQPANVPGLRHLCFEVDDIEDTVERLRGQGGELLGEIVDFGNVYRLGYLRGPAGVIIELAEKL